MLKEAEPYRTLMAAKHARDTLLAGFTTLRDLGTEGAGFADVSVKKAIDDGLVEGPRLFVATRAIVATSSYGPGPRGFRPDLELPSGAQPVSGVDAAIAAVREQAGRGADWIKVYADYRVGADGSTQPTFTQAELDAIVEAAHLGGRPVSAHTASDAGMRMSIAAGVDSIEHGDGGSAATFKSMREHGVAYLPTLTAVEATETYFNHYRPGDPPTPKMQQAAQAFRTRARGRGHHRQRQRRRRVPPRRQRARNRMDGEAGHEPDRGLARGDFGGCADPAPAGPHRPHRPGPARGPGRLRRRPDCRHRRAAAAGVRDEGRRGLPPALNPVAGARAPGLA